MTEVLAVALDPGRTTGYAMGHIKDGLMIVTTGQRKWEPYELLQFLEDSKPQYIICERFNYRQGGTAGQWGADLYPRELIGVCKVYEGDPRHGCELVMQNVLKNSKTTYYNNDRLRAGHIYKPARDHANDAARHLLHWFKFGSGFQYNTKGYKSGALA